MRRFGRLLASNEIGLACVIGVFWLIFAAAAATFFSPFNLYSLGRFVAADLVIAARQKVVRADGLARAVPGRLVRPRRHRGGGLRRAGGALVVGTGINGFIITLATLSAYRGINYGITQSQPFYGMPEALKAFGVDRWGAVPVLVIVPLALIPAVALLMNRSVLGRHPLAVGGNPQAAALSGIPSGRTRIAAHVLSATLAAVAGPGRALRGQPHCGSRADDPAGTGRRRGHPGLPDAMRGPPRPPNWLKVKRFRRRMRCYSQAHTIYTAESLPRATD